MMQNTLRAIWLPALGAMIGIFLISWVGGEALRHQALGTSEYQYFRWLIDPFVSKSLMFSIVSLASLWSGYRAATFDPSAFYGAVAGVAVPATILLVLLLFSIAESGPASLGGYIQPIAVVDLGVTLAGAILCGVFGVYFGGRRVSAA